MYEYFEQILQMRHMTAADVCRLTGIDSSTISTWKKRKSVLNASLLLKISRVLDCTIEDLLGSSNLEWNPETQEVDKKDGYFFDHEAREYAQFLYENPEYRALFDASRKVKPKDIEYALRSLGILIDMGDEDEGNNG